MTMKRTRLSCLSAIALLLILGGCSTSREGALKLYQRNSGDIINLYVGETVTVLLDGDPGTDIHWIKVPGDPEILTQLGSTEFEPDLESHDAARKLTTRFQAVAPGRTRLHLNYSHPTDARRTSGRIARDQAFEVWVVVKQREE